MSTESATNATVAKKIQKAKMHPRKLARAMARKEFERQGYDMKYFSQNWKKAVASVIISGGKRGGTYKRGKRRVSN